MRYDSDKTRSLVFRVAHDAAPALRARASLLARAASKSAIVVDSTEYRPQGGTVTYYVDALSEAFSECAIRGLPYILDVGDVAADVRANRDGRGLASLVMSVLEKFLHSRALGTVYRGMGHGGMLSAGREGRLRVLFLPDFPFLPSDVVLSGPPSSLNDFTLGFMGRSEPNRNGVPAGWHLLEWLSNGPGRVSILGAGKGMEVLRSAADFRLLSDRVTFSENFQDVQEFANGTHALFLPQSDNRLANVRTTGKLVEYLAWKRPILTSAVGTAGMLLPQSMLFPSVPLDGPSYAKRLRTATNMWSNFGQQQWAEQVELLGPVQSVLDARSRLVLWRSSLELWIS